MTRHTGIPAGVQSSRDGRAADPSAAGGLAADARDRAAPSRLLARAAGALLLLAAGLVTAAAPAPAADKPNIVYILADDADVALTEHMPNVKSLIAARGATFTSAYFNDPLCCPSRATILTGRYVQNTGVHTNSHRLFVDNGNPDRTFAVWLKAAGYRTGFIGKLLNGYPRPGSVSYRPPGWDYWAIRLDDGGITMDLQFDYRLAENGRAVSYGNATTDYSTDVYARKAAEFIRSTPAGTPLLLEVAVHAPHKPTTPAPRHANSLSTIKAPRPPSFNEADVSDKPAYVREEGLVSGTTMDNQHRQRARSMLAVDEAVKKIVDALSATGRLGNTYLIYSSDNGWLQGIHRLVRKGPPYEEGIKMPLYVRGPGITAGSTVPHLVGNADFAPTFAEWAGTSPSASVDGRSFAPLLRAGAPSPDAWRQTFPMWYARRSSDGTQPGWSGLRTRTHAYVEYTNGEKELYDMAADRYQLNNIAKTADPGFLSRLSEATRALYACSGDECRRLENESVAP